MQSSIKVFANLAGRIWSAVIGIVLVPFYIKFLGIESYGLVGFYGTLLGSMSLLDLGLTLTLNRELTKAVATNKDPQLICDMVFSMECIYWLIGIVVAFTLVALASTISIHWLKVTGLEIHHVKNAVMLMGVVIAFQWPISLYNGGLLGLEKQVIDNIIMILMTTIRSGGVIFLLLFNQSIEAFFIWQAGASLLYVLTMRFTLWAYLPKSFRQPKFSKTEIKNIWRFAAGMTGMSFAGFFVSQADKIVLSKILTLPEFAYYTLSFTIVNGVTILVGSVYTTYFPQLTASVVANDKKALYKIYHTGCKTAAAILYPTAFTFLFFSKEILFIWTHNWVTVNHLIILTKVLVTGTIFGNLMGIPNILTLASGHTKYGSYQYGIASLVIVPLLFWLSSLYGALGGVLVYLILNMGYFFISIPLIHKLYLRGQYVTWLIKDAIKPIFAPLITLCIFKFINIYLPNQFKINIYTLILISTLTFLISILAVSEKKILNRLFSNG